MDLTSDEMKIFFEGAAMGAGVELTFLSPSSLRGHTCRGSGVEMREYRRR